MPGYLNKEVLVLGCGNVLFGDDGFGYAIVNKLNELKEEYPILKSDKIQIIDAGTGASHFILSLIDDQTPLKKIIIADIIDYGLIPGELKKLYAFDLPNIAKYHIDAHDMPLAGMLKDIHENYGVKIVVVGCQQKNVPAPDILLELSPEVNSAIDDAVKMIIDELNE
ncbi:coenzyme F420-reducing hydrogenase delta subunit [Methanococcus vannielii SB]|uniref:Coenzyme F420-reducing hydrogenase delta subunit n=1 Tax=Methanococcus vannielii (strain ATCC 35089 / DSM 1224 / JCM 13029 / OCM 148 / SB) TaxID=406327 RepID=A6UNB6_METVS|nr:coenzyme F420-reducing hydrogenase, FrhD protein [Methanococcus vannielii]ABR53988.1 coenzyme F420-reducing hydrogenase delta subunit [Methanococcus vannielii SB]